MDQSDGDYIEPDGYQIAVQKNCSALRSDLHCPRGVITANI